MKLYYDHNGIFNEVIPSIDDTIAKLRSTLETANGISTPADASLSIILTDTKKEIVNNIKELEKIKEWLERSDRVIKNRTESIKSGLGQVDFQKIKEREKWIKEIAHEE